jgi:putative SOS response-associated peptidase YedK
MGLAGLWSTWRSPSGEQIESFTMLTINADSHGLMRRFHKPEDEKRMIVILPPERYDDWLRAKPEQSFGFLLPYPADKLCVATE